MTAPGPGRPWDDDLADAIAIALAIQADDIQGLAALLSNCNLGKVTVALGKLLGEVTSELEVTECHLRFWAALAVRRP